MKYPDLPPESPKPPDVKGQKIVCRHPEVCWFCSRYPEISDEISRSPVSKKCIMRSGSFFVSWTFFGVAILSSSLKL